jgi:hypothetical protein
MLDFYRDLTAGEKGWVWAAGVAVVALVMVFGNEYQGVAAGAQVAAAAGTFILAGLAYSQVREMRAARIAQERPQVIVDVDHSKPPLVNVVLRNIGQGAAKDIVFDFSAPMEIPEGANNPYVVPLNKQGYFEQGMDFLAPGAELSTLWGSMPTLAPFLREQGLEAGVTITSRYKSLAGEFYESVWKVNPLLVANRISTPEKTLKHVVESLDRISSKL